MTCVSEREQATAEARSGNNAIFIPECKPNGKFQFIYFHLTKKFTIFIKKGIKRFLVQFSCVPRYKGQKFVCGLG